VGPPCKEAQIFCAAAFIAFNAHTDISRAFPVKMASAAGSLPRRSNVSFRVSSAANPDAAAFPKQHHVGQHQFDTIATLRQKFSWPRHYCRQYEKYLPALTALRHFCANT